MANIAYVRVSTKEQNTGRQYADFAAAGVDLYRIFEDKMSGSSKERPELKKMLDYVRDGDTLYVESFSRLARSTKDLLEIVDILTSKGVGFISLKEQINTSTPSGKFMLTLFGALAQLERDNIRQRQREGIDLALSEGRPYGRPSAAMSATFAKNYQKWKAGEIKAVEFMRLERLAKTTFYRLVKRFEAQNSKNK